MKLIIISSDYPFLRGNAEYNILSIQYNLLSKSFSEIYVLPTGKINSSSRKFENFSILKGFRKTDFLLFGKIIIYGFKFSHYLFSDLLSIKINSFFQSALIESLRSYFKAVYFFSYLKFKSKSKAIDLNDILIYSFWFNDYALGALFIKLKYPSCKVITGSHGHDLYPERHLGKRIPFRKHSMKLIDHVFTDSLEGEQYLKRSYQEFNFKISSLNSGIKKKSHMANKSNDGILRILTLSRTHPVKRIDYLLKTLIELEKSTDFKIHYIHIGSGEELNNLKRLKEELNFKKFKIEFKGNISDKKLKTFFEEKPIDVFLNVSSSEGTSMALIEALSYGIPTIVTNVGGNKTIGDYCKTLLPIDYTAKDLFEYFEKIHSDSTYRNQLRKLSYSYWLKNHDVEVIDSKINKVFKETAKS